MGGSIGRVGQVLRCKRPARGGHSNPHCTVRPKLYRASHRVDITPAKGATQGRALITEELTKLGLKAKVLGLCAGRHRNARCDQN